MPLTMAFFYDGPDILTSVFEPTKNLGVDITIHPHLVTLRIRHGGLNFKARRSFKDLLEASNCEDKKKIRPIAGRAQAVLKPFA